MDIRIGSDVRIFTIHQYNLANKYGVYSDHTQDSEFGQIRDYSKGHCHTDMYYSTECLARAARLLYQITLA